MRKSNDSKGKSETRARIFVAVSSSLLGLSNQICVVRSGCAVKDEGKNRAVRGFNRLILPGQIYGEDASLAGKVPHPDSAAAFFDALAADR